MKRYCLQLHRLLGVTAGAVLAVMGVTGALLSFEHGLLRWLNPGVMTVTPLPMGPLPPRELLARIQGAVREKRVIGMELSVHPEDAVRVRFTAQLRESNSRQPQAVRQGDGSRGGEWRYVDPYTGAILGEAWGQSFFRSVMEMHRRLVLGDVGKAITGASTLALVVLCLSGLYLRWPRSMWKWRAWLKINTTLKGRSFLWHLHAVTGTWVLLLYLLVAVTGLFWSYAWYRNSVFALTGASPPNREGVSLATPITDPPDLALLWPVFLRESGGFSTATVTFPERLTQAVEIRYLATSSPHERAFNSIVLHPTSGAVLRHDRYPERSVGAKLVNSVFAFHSGGFWGTPGIVIMMVASLSMPLFAVTGWLLYLTRRAKTSASALSEPVTSEG